MQLRRVILLVLCSSLALAGIASAQAAPAAPPLRSPDVIYVPTPPEVVEAMLKLAKVGPNDIVYDLGSGDGRIPIAAVQDFNAKAAVGIDIDPQRIKEATGTWRRRSRQPREVPESGSVHDPDRRGDGRHAVSAAVLERNLSEATEGTAPRLEGRLAELQHGRPVETDETIQVQAHAVYSGSSVACDPCWIASRDRMASPRR